MAKHKEIAQKGDQRAEKRFVQHTKGINAQLDILKGMVEDHFGCSTGEVRWPHAWTVQRVDKQLTEIILSLDGLASK